MSYVPLAGPTCVALPVDPLEILSQRWGLTKLDLYEERWKVENSEVLPYLKRHLPTGRGICVAEQQWRSGGNGGLAVSRLQMTFAQTACVDDHEIIQLKRPLSPVLTARARLETPRAGKSALPLPQTDGELLRYCKIAKVEVIPLPDPSVRTDDALYVPLFLVTKLCN